MGRAVAAILLAGAVAGAAAFAHLLASEPTLPAFGASALPSAPGSPLVVQAAPWAPPRRSAVSTQPGQLAVGPPARTIVITRIKTLATATHPARVQPAHVAAGVSLTPAATRPRSTKPTATKPAPAPVAPAPAPAATPAPVAVVTPAPTDRGVAQAPAVPPSGGKHQGDGEQHHGQGNEDKHGGDHGGNNGNNGNKGEDKSSTVLAAVQIVSPTPPQVVAPTPPQVVAPQAPQVVAPQAPQVVAPQAPQVVAPQAPQVVAPQAPQIVAPQLPFSGGTGDKHGHGDAGGDDSH
jgi:hypothetical protein